MPLIGDKVPTISLEEQLATFINTFQNGNVLLIYVEDIFTEDELNRYLKVNHQVTCSLLTNYLQGV